MSAKKSTMQSGTQNAPDTSADAVAKGMAASLKKAILQKGLNRLDEVERDYNGARNIFAACPFWPEVERKCSPILAKARQEQQAEQQAEQEGQREYELKLAGIKGHQDEHPEWGKNATNTITIHNNNVGERHTTFAPGSVAQMVGVNEGDVVYSEKGV